MIKTETITFTLNGAQYKSNLKTSDIFILSARTNSNEAQAVIEPDGYYYFCIYNYVKREMLKTGTYTVNFTYVDL